MTTVCIANTDLSELRLLNSAASGAWMPEPLRADEKPTAAALRARAVEAAAWLAGSLTGKRRLPLLCLDVGDGSFLWVRSPSSEMPVLSAAVRGAGQDWGDNFPASGIEALTSPDLSRENTGRASRLSFLSRSLGSKSSGSGPVKGPVLSAPISLARIWIDELDARGVRPELIATFWHAMARAWATSEEPSSGDLTAVLLALPDRRLEWCWCRGADLITGGRVALELPGDSPESIDDPVAQAHRVGSRLSLDWLAWAAPLGAMPRSAIVIGPKPDALIDTLTRRYPEMSISSRTTDAPMEDTLRRAAEHFETWRDAAVTPQRAMPTLMSRPGRAVRAQFRWAALALLLLAVAAAGLATRFRQAAANYTRVAEEVQSQQAQIVATLNDPQLAQTRNLVMALGSELTTLRKREPIKLPPAPKPIYEEVGRVLAALGKHEGVRILQFAVDSRGNSSLNISVPDRQVAAEIRVELSSSPGSIAWKDAGGANSDRQLRLTGTWTQ